MCILCVYVYNNNNNNNNKKKKKKKKKKKNTFTFLNFFPLSFLRGLKIKKNKIKQ